MSATVIPGATSPSFITVSASLKRSRSSSFEKRGETIGETGRSGSGKGSVASDFRHPASRARGMRARSATRLIAPPLDGKGFSEAKARLVDIFDVDLFAGHAL